jgi:2-iminobutanoate/2-iminopropanoate deaminase
MVFPRDGGPVCMLPTPGSLGQHSDPSCSVQPHRVRARTVREEVSVSRKVIGEPIEIGGRPLPLSGGIAANGFLFLSGQLGTDASFRLVGEDVESQTRQALANLAALLEEGGCGLGDLVKVTAFVTDAAHAAGFNRVYAEVVPAPPPARSTVVSGLLLPGALVEIEAIAALPEGG